jgi:hypothetical protein
MSWPATVAEPEVGGSNVMSILMVVVLPAPFGPSRPNTSPGLTSSVSASTAVTDPNSRRRSRVSIAACTLTSLIYN